MAPRISSAAHSLVPQYSALPDDTMSLIAHTVSSSGVSGSERWQYRTSTNSTPSRSSDPSMACSRYLRFSVFFMFGASWMPQKTFVVSTYDQRGQPSSASTRPMIASLSPPA